MKKKAVSMVLAGALVLGLLAGCGASGPAGEPADTPEVKNEADASEKPEGETEKPEPEETPEETDQQGGSPEGEFQMPEVVPLEGEVTEIRSGTVEKIFRDIVVEEEVKGQVEFLVYTPSDIRPIGPSTPAVMVYGEGKTDVGDAEELLATSGLDAIAKEANCSVMFVNPVQDAWGEADLEAYLYTLVDLWSEDTGSETGKTAGQDKIIGSTQRIYVIADGAGADFAAQYLTQDGVKKFNIFADFYYLPAGEILYGTTRDEVKCGYGMPAALVGGSETLIEAWKAMNGTDGQEEGSAGTLYTNTREPLKKLLAMQEADSYDKEALKAGWNLVYGARRQLIGYENPDSYELLPMYNFEDYGIEVSIERARLGDFEIEWYQYIPEDLDMASGEGVPLVFTFHGGGNHAEYQANASEWPLIAKENGFMVVAVNQHVEQPAEHIVALLSYLEEKYPAIDKTRIYASGFSMGSLKSWECGMQYPELFAGIAPMDAVEEPVWDVKEMVIPTYYLAGEEDGLLVFPHQAAFGSEGGEGNGDYIIKRLFEMNQIAYKGYDEALDPIWGMEFDHTEKVDTTGNGLHVVTENYLKSGDGNTYTVLASMSNQAHAVLAGSARSAWNFLKQFSRNEDGTISITK